MIAYYKMLGPHILPSIYGNRTTDSLELWHLQFAFCYRLLLGPHTFPEYKQGPDYGFPTALKFSFFCDINAQPPDAREGKVYHHTNCVEKGFAKWQHFSWLHLFPLCHLTSHFSYLYEHRQKNKENKLRSNINL